MLMVCEKPEDFLFNLTIFLIIHLLKNLNEICYMLFALSQYLLEQRQKYIVATLCCLEKIILKSDKNLF